MAFMAGTPVSRRLMKGLPLKGKLAPNRLGALIWMNRGYFWLPAPPSVVAHFTPKTASWLVSSTAFAAALQSAIRVNKDWKLDLDQSRAAQFRLRPTIDGTPAGMWRDNSPAHGV
jgi:hypothetical protein